MTAFRMAGAPFKGKTAQPRPGSDNTSSTKPPLLAYIEKLPPGLANVHLSFETDCDGGIGNRTFSHYSAAALLPWALLVAERLATGRLPHLVCTQRRFTGEIDRASKLPVKRVSVFVFERRKVRKLSAEQAEAYLECPEHGGTEDEHAEFTSRTDLVYV